MEAILLPCPSACSIESTLVLLLAELGDLRGEDSTPLLTELHELEAVKVGEGSTDSAPLELLGPTGGLPLGDDLLGLKGLANGGGTGSTGKVLDLEGSQGHVLVGVGVTGDTSGGTLDESTVVVDDVNDDGKTAIVTGVVEEDNASNLDHTVESTFLQPSEKREKERGNVSE